jgi:hypothetical protein
MQPAEAFVKFAVVLVSSTALFKLKETIIPLLPLPNAKHPLAIVDIHESIWGVRQFDEGISRRRETRPEAQGYSVIE